MNFYFRPKMVEKDFSKSEYIGVVLLKKYNMRWAVAVDVRYDKWPGYLRHFP